MKHPLFFMIALFLISIFCLSAFGQNPASTTLAGIQKGDSFSDEKIPPLGRVTDVYVFAEDSICAVQLQFTLSDGRAWTSPERGSSGCHQNTFHLNPDEYIIGLSGRFETHIHSLQIRTNKRASPLFGGKGGNQEYTVDVNAGNMGVGFTGKSGRYLNAIGLNFITVNAPLTGQTMIFGGSGGEAFSDVDVPRGAKISEVRVRSGDKVYSLQAIYTLLDGRLLEGAIHGGNGGGLGIFRLDADEYFIGLVGRSGVCINSLSIRTNKRTSQAFGGSGGDKAFSVNTPAGKKVLGFRGRAGQSLDAIGLNLTTPEKDPRDK
jgi:hypothetical protein